MNAFFMRSLEQIINLRQYSVVFTAEGSQQTGGKSIWLMNVDIEQLDIFGSAGLMVNMTSSLVKMTTD